VLQCVLQHGTVRRCVLQCVAVCCSVLTWFIFSTKKSTCCSVAVCAAMTHSVLQCVAMCCGVVTWFVFSKKESRCVLLHHKGMAFYFCTNTKEEFLNFGQILKISRLRGRRGGWVGPSGPVGTFGTRCGQKKLLYPLAATRTATYCNMLQHNATAEQRSWSCLQHTATHLKTLQHTVVHCNTHCNTLQHTATHCNTLQQQYRGAGHTFKTPQHTATHTITYCNILRHIATHCNNTAEEQVMPVRHCTAM